MPLSTRTATPRPASQGDKPAENAARRPVKRPRNSAEEHTPLGKKLIAGVPARYMRPRLIFIACLVALVLFGLLMVYSASSVEALKEEGDALYYIKRQFGYAAVGALITISIACGVPCKVTRLRTGLFFAWAIVDFMLLVVTVSGLGAGGATRWIPLGPVTIQPSEFLKPVVVLLVATLFFMHYEEETLQRKTYLFMLFVGIIAPLLLVALQPDLGTMIIIIVPVFIMAIMAGVRWTKIILIGSVVLTAGFAYMMSASYRLKRFAALDPWSDPYDTTYQAAISNIAFSSGGLFGRGIGGSTMKYFYLPEAHNDYILAVIGEEVGFVGTLIFIAVFAALVLAAFRIAMRCSNLQGRLIAAGAGGMLGVQFFVNAMGILNILPMTGKPLPFISYGGSSIWSCLILAGLILRVSIESSAETVHDAARGSFSVMGHAFSAFAPTQQDDVSSHLGRSTAGMPHKRNDATRRPTAAERGFSVYDGGASPRVGRSAPLAGGASNMGSTSRGRDWENSAERPSGYERVNLGSDTPGDRLRNDGVRYRGRRDDQDGWGRGRYDR